ncbi:MAG: hypothetical protein FK730_12965 [Asgard group archaeon]|nr:hypothetical protein [Asgard group archaeon]
MSNKKGKETQSIITVRALCDICKEVDAFQIPTKELLPHFGGLYQISTIHHCKDNKEMVMNIVLDRNFAVRQTTVSPFVAEREIDRWSKEKVSDIRFLVKQIKDSDRVVQAVLSGRLVVIASSNRTFVKRIVHTLELFSPTKFPQSIEWTTEVVKNKKIVGTSMNIARQYKNAIIVELDKNKVNNGKSSKYCQNLLQDLITLEPEGMAYAAKLKIGMLVEFAKMLIELSKEPEIGTKALNLIKRDVSDDALELIIEMVHGFDPTAIEIIKEEWL